MICRGGSPKTIEDQAARDSRPAKAGRYTYAWRERGNPVASGFSRTSLWAISPGNQRIEGIPLVLLLNESLLPPCWKYQPSPCLLISNPTANGPTPTGVTICCAVVCDSTRLD
jgi:hypothetical protein